MRLLPVLTALVTLAAGAARGNEIVILKSGKRLEVERAHAAGRVYDLKLVGGGSVRIPAEVVKRVSNAAADMPKAVAPQIASTGAWSPSPRAEAEIPDEIPQDAIREAPGRFEPPEGGLKAPRVDPRSLVPGQAGLAGGIGRPSLTDQAKTRPVSPSPFAGKGFRRAGRPSAFGGGESRPSGQGDPAQQGGLPRLP